MSTITPGAPARPATPQESKRGRHFKPPALLKSSRGAVRRLMFRSPILLYRLGLGRLLGHEFLLLTHAGRRTGLVHQTVLKVLHFDPATGESIVVSAWGPRAAWYRNIQARPALEVYAGRDWYVPEQRYLPADEAFAVFTAWTRREPRFARLMLGQIGLSLDQPEAELRRLIGAFPFVGLRPANASPSLDRGHPSSVR